MTTTMDLRQSDARIRTSILLFFVVGLAIAAFLPALSGGWVYDDHPLIAHNPYAHSLEWLPRWFTHDFWNVDEEVVRLGRRIVYWRPLISTSYATDWQIGGGSPLMFHITNALAHGAVAALSFVVLRRWIGHAVPACLATLLFVVHPTKVESVAWISGRTDVFCMAAILIATVGIARRFRGARYGLTLEIVGTVAAYLCKEQAIVLPAFVLIEKWISLDRPPIDLAFVRKAWRALVPQTALAITYLALRGIFLPIRTETAGKMGVGHHAASVADTMGRFFELTFAPNNLSIQQGLIHHDGGVLQHSLPHVIVGSVGVVAFVAIAFLARRRWAFATLAIGFFLVTLAPTSNLVYTGMSTLISERFLYLPVFGLAFGVGVLLSRAPDRWRSRLFALTGVAILAMTVASARRSADFADERTFWERELAMHPNSRQARTARIVVAIQEKRYQGALVEILDLHKYGEAPDVGLALDMTYMVASVLAQLVPDKDVNSLRKIDEFCAHLLDRDRPAAEIDLRGVQFGMSMRAKSYPGWLARYSPHLYSLRADLASRLGDSDAALRFLERARSCSSCLTVVKVEALVLGRLGRIDEGLAALDRVDPGAVDTRLAATRAALHQALSYRDQSLTTQGPASLQQRAYELAALEAWGAAYDVLAPHKEQIKRAPAFAEGFAELAFRAGETAVARDVLQPRSAADIDALLSEWGDRMGWRM